MSDPKIFVEVTYVGSDQPLLRVFDANVDLDTVVIKRTEHAIKALVPIEMIISAISGALLSKFVLNPILDPIAENFNWKKAVEKYLEPHQSFRLAIRLTNEGLLLESDDIYNRIITAGIWDTVSKTLKVLQNEHLIGKVTRVRFSVGSDNMQIIAAYHDKQPLFLIDIDKEEIESISETTKLPSSDANLSDEDWIIKQLDLAAQYRQSLNQQGKTESSDK